MSQLFTGEQVGYLILLDIYQGEIHFHTLFNTLRHSYGS